MLGTFISTPMGTWQSLELVTNVVYRIIAASKLVLRWEGTIDHPFGPSLITKVLACGREMTVLTGGILTWMVLNAGQGLGTGQHSEAGKDKTISRRNAVYDLEL